jgi:hypothetical protein
MKMIVESMMECRLAGETEVLGENCPGATFVHHKIPHAHPGLNPGRRGGKPATNRLSYGAALHDTLETAGETEFVAAACTEEVNTIESRTLDPQQSLQYVMYV